MTFRARLVAALLPVLACVGPDAAAQSLAQTLDDAPLVIRRSGGQYSFVDDDDPDLMVLVAVGGVELQKGERRLLGDTLVVLIDASAAGTPRDDESRGQLIPSERVLEVFVDGHVSIEEGDEQTAEAAAVFIDNRTGVVTLMDGSWRRSLESSPAILRFEIMRQFAAGRLEVEGATFTTCEYAHAHWGLDSPWMLVEPSPEGRLLKTSFNLGWVAGVPLAPLPAFHFDIDRDRPPLRSVAFGTSTRFGTELETKWGGDASAAASDVGRWFGAERVDAEWGFEWSDYTRRGIFYEPSWEYSTDSSSGRILGAYIHDRQELDQVDRRIEDSTRGRFDLAHRTRIDDTRVIDTEVSYLSDRGFMREYYENEDRTAKPQETYVNYRDVQDNVATQVLVRSRLNAWQTQVEYLPRVERRVTGEVVDAGPLGDLSMSGREFADVARLQRGEPVELVLGPNGQPVVPQPPQPPAGSLSTDVIRVGSRRSLTKAFEVGGDKLTVTSGYDLAGFSKQQALDTSTPSGFAEDERDTGRYALTAAASWGSTWSGSDPTVDSDLWNFDGVRQVVEPLVGFNSVLELNRPPTGLVAIDDEETLDKLMVFNLGLRHRVQTHQGGKVATVLDTEVDMPVFTNQDRDNAGNDLGFMTIDSKWTPAADITGLRAATLTVRTTLDPANKWGYVKSFESYSTRFGDTGRFSVIHASAAHSNDFVTVGTEWKLTPKWTGGVFVQEDLRLNAGVRRGILLRQRAHRWLIDVELAQRRSDSFLTGDTNLEESVTFRFRPAAFVDEDEPLIDRFARRTQFGP